MRKALSAWRMARNQEMSNIERRISNDEGSQGRTAEPSNNRTTERLNPADWQDWRLIISDWG